MNKSISENVKSIMDCLDTAVSCVYCDEETAYDMITGALEELSDMLPKIGVFVWLYDSHEGERFTNSFKTREEAEEALKEDVEKMKDCMTGDGELSDNGTTVRYSSENGYSFNLEWKRYYEPEKEQK